jgi:hypothetical protein
MPLLPRNPALQSGAAGNAVGDKKERPPAGHRRRSLEVNKKKPLSRVLLTVWRIVKCEWLNPPLKVTLSADLQMNRVLVFELVDSCRLWSRRSQNCSAGKLLVEVEPLDLCRESQILDGSPAGNEA